MADICQQNVETTSKVFISDVFANINHFQGTPNKVYRQARPPEG